MKIYESMLTKESDDTAAPLLDAARAAAGLLAADAAATERDRKITDASLAAARAAGAFALGVRRSDGGIDADLTTRVRFLGELGRGCPSTAWIALSGSGIYWVGEHRYELSAGGVVVVPRGVPMAHRITSDAETLAITTPGGLETFFRLVGRDVSQPRPDGWQFSYELMGQAADATGQTVLAAPLEADEMIPEPVLGR